MVLASVDSSGGPVGLLRKGVRTQRARLVVVLTIAVRSMIPWRDDAGFLNTFDLGDPAVVDGDLDGSETQVRDVLADDFQPIGFRAVLRRALSGGRFHGGPEVG